MLMKILGFVEFAFGMIVGLHLLYGLFSVNTVMLALDFFFLRGAIFIITSKDLASVVDVVFGVYALLAINGVFSLYLISIALIVWHSQKAIFSLLG